MTLDPDHQEFLQLGLDSYKRLNSLYYITTKEGKKIKFQCNWAQRELYENMWYCNIVLKARQLGISTFICMLFLDRCLFNDNVSAGIICHTREDAELMFKRVKYAYDNLPSFMAMNGIVSQKIISRIDNMISESEDKISELKTKIEILKKKEQI